MRYLLAATAVVLLAAIPVRAENPDKKPMSADNLISPGAMTPTPEMWFYQQYQQQYQDPKAMVRHNAELRENERHRRLATLKWYGMSNQRPRVSSDPYNGDYSAAWASGDWYFPNRWQYSTPYVVLPKDASR